MKKNLNIGFVGLSHLGLNYLAASSKKGFKVIGVDLNKQRIKKLKNIEIEYEEPNLKETIHKNKKNIFFSSNFNDLKFCHIVFISQDVSSDNKGKSDFNSLKILINKAKKFLDRKAILIVLSQVQPGFTRMIKFDYSRLYYQVETLIIGKSLQRALYPERIIIGCFSSKSKISNLLLNYLKKFNCPIIKMKYESAELSKLSINILLASSIITTNMLARVCEKTTADWYEILPALQLDQRIGKKAYLKPGPGISGGNIERDICSIGEILKKEKKPLSVIKTFQSNSLYMKSWVYRVLKNEKILSKSKKFNIGVLGLAYKANTNSVKNSPTVHLLKKIKKNNIIIYDPKARLEKKIKNCVQVDNIKQILKNSNVIILMTQWHKFNNIGKILQSQKNKKVILIDPYRLIDSEKIKNKNFKYFTIGK